MSNLNGYIDTSNFINSNDAGGFTNTKEKQFNDYSRNKDKKLIIVLLVFIVIVLITNIINYEKKMLFLTEPKQFNNYPNRAKPTIFMARY